MKITSPIEKFTGRTHFGPFMLDFKDGVAEVAEGESLPAGTRAYLESHGYTVEDEAQEDEDPFDPAKHNQDEVIAYLEADGQTAEEVERVLAVEDTRENGTRQKVAKWVEARDADEKAKQDGQTGGDGQGTGDQGGE